jgi:hypothetical protein
VKDLSLPFDVPASELDAYLAEIDRELDALFLCEVEGTVDRLRAGRAAPADGAEPAAA